MSKPTMSEHEMKMLGLQHQIRENQTDLQDFLKDMNSWEKDIRTKDERLKKDKADIKNELPPVRNSLNKKKKKKKIAAKLEDNNSEDTKASRISGYDYRAWDKFDVDKACETVDKNEKSSESEYETDEEWEDERNKQRALMEKDKGNQYFKEGKYDLAIECYSLGMELDPTNPLLPANRALVFLKQEKYAAAEEDSSYSLSLDPLYVKGLLRRATARLGLDKLDLARGDYNKILQIEPKNKQARQELLKIEKKKSQSNADSLNTAADNPSDIGIIRAITKPLEERSKKPLIRIPIEEIGVDGDNQWKHDIAKLEATQSQTKREITLSDNRSFQQFITPIQKPNIEPNPPSHLHEPMSSFVPESPSKSAELSANQPSGHVCSDIKKKTQEAAASGQRDDLPDIPSSSFQFQADWKVLKGNMEKFYIYFRRINPNHYIKLFGQALDADILMKVLTVMRDYFIPAGDDVYKSLQQLVQVKRFSMTLIFLSSKDKKELFQMTILRLSYCKSKNITPFSNFLQDIFQYLYSIGDYSKDDLMMLETKYEVR